MITDEELDSLPDDPDEAFVMYEGILRDYVRTANANQENPDWDMERQYVAQILAFVDTRGIPLELPTNPPDDPHTFSRWYQNFLRAVDYYRAVARLEISRRKKVNVTVLTLSPDFKTKIGAHLTAIRKIVFEANMAESKRDAIFRRISNLQEEVDRDRTRTEAGLALWLDITSAIGKGAENLDPAIERVKKIFDVFAKAKDEAEQKALTSPPERKRIAPPTTAPEQQPGRGPLDDDIPF